ncbi:hypothetical protein T484DRAFT_1963457, partial [Baffinella frigidus]
VRSPPPDAAASRLHGGHGRALRERPHHQLAHRLQRFPRGQQPAVLHRVRHPRGLPFQHRQL